MRLLVITYLAHNSDISVGELQLMTDRNLLKEYDAVICRNE